MVTYEELKKRLLEIISSVYKMDNFEADLLKDRIDEINDYDTIRIMKMIENEYDLMHIDDSENIFIFEESSIDELVDIIYNEINEKNI